MEISNQRKEKKTGTFIYTFVIWRFTSVHYLVRQSYEYFTSSTHDAILAVAKQLDRWRKSSSVNSKFQPLNPPSEISTNIIANFHESTCHFTLCIFLNNKFSSNASKRTFLLITYHLFIYIYIKKNTYHLLGPSPICCCCCYCCCSR